MLSAVGAAMTALGGVILASAAASRWLDLHLISTPPVAVSHRGTATGAR